MTPACSSSLEWHPWSPPPRCTAGPVSFSGRQPEHVSPQVPRCGSPACWGQNLPGVGCPLCTSGSFHGSQASPPPRSRSLVHCLGSWWSACYCSCTMAAPLWSCSAERSAASAACGCFCLWRGGLAAVSPGGRAAGSCKECSDEAPRNANAGPWPPPQCPVPPRQLPGCCGAACGSARSAVVPPPFAGPNCFGPPLGLVSCNMPFRSQRRVMDEEGAKVSVRFGVFSN